MEEQHQSSRENILACAETLFAAKGFDGTSVDAIAKAAHINKATIYYYFPSKQNILDHLIDGFMRQFTEMTMQMVEKAKMQGIYQNNLTIRDSTIRINDEKALGEMVRLLDSWLDFMLQFFIGNRNILRIMITESVKDGGGETLLFRLSDLLTMPGAYGQQMRELGIPTLPDDIIVMKFFGGFLPIVYYAVCGDAWERHYDTQKEALRTGLMRLFQYEVTGYYASMEAGNADAD